MSLRLRKRERKTSIAKNFRNISYLFPLLHIESTEFEIRQNYLAPFFKSNLINAFASSYRGWLTFLKYKCRSNHFTLRLRNEGISIFFVMFSRSSSIPTISAFNQCLLKNVDPKDHQEYLRLHRQLYRP